MLEVYDSDYREADIVDIDAAFSKLILEADDNMNNLVKSIDGGTLIDSYTFFDRFGVKLYVSELSTGLLHPAYRLFGSWNLPSD